MYLKSNHYKIPITSNGNQSDYVYYRPQHNERFNSSVCGMEGILYQVCDCYIAVHVFILV